MFLIPLLFSFLLVLVLLQITYNLPGLVVVVTSSKLKKEKPIMVYLQSGHHLITY